MPSSSGPSGSFISFANDFRALTCLENTQTDVRDLITTVGSPPVKKIFYNRNTQVRLSSKESLQKTYRRMVDWLEGQVTGFSASSHDYTPLHSGIRRLELITTWLDCPALKERVKKVRYALFGMDEALADTPLKFDDPSHHPVGKMVPRELEQHIRWSADHADFHKDECVAIKNHKGELRFGRIGDFMAFVPACTKYLAAYREGITIHYLKNFAIPVEVQKEDYRLFDASQLHQIGRISEASADTIRALAAAPVDTPLEQPASGAVSSTASSHEPPMQRRPIRIIYGPGVRMFKRPAPTRTPSPDETQGMENRSTAAPEPVTKAARAD